MKFSRNKSTWAPIIFLGLFVLVLVLPRVFSGAWVLPQFFSVGPLTIHYYGITMALAVGSAWWLASQRASRYGLNHEQVDALSLWLVVGGFLGARLYHIASSWRYYWQYPLESFQIWHGGLSIFGALLGGFVVLIFSRRLIQSGPSPRVASAEALAKVDEESIARSSALFSPHGGDISLRDREGLGEVIETFDNTQTLLRPPLTPPQAGENNTKRLLSLLDWLAPSVLLGQIVGRFGNFFNYEAFGYPTSLPWKMFVPEYFRPTEYLSASYFHPLFLYEALGNALILFVLLYFFRSTRKKTGMPTPFGALFFSYLILYNTLRFALEHLRTDSTFLASGVRLNSITSAVLWAVGLIGLWYAYGVKQRRARSENFTA